jgi:hypothetical protein
MKKTEAYCNIRGIEFVLISAIAYDKQTEKKTVLMCACQRLRSLRCNQNAAKLHMRKLAHVTTTTSVSTVPSCTCA